MGQREYGIVPVHIGLQTLIVREVRKASDLRRSYSRLAQAKEAGHKKVGKQSFHCLIITERTRGCRMTPHESLQ